MGEALFTALGLPPSFRHVSLGLMTGIITALDVAGLVSPALRDKAQLARIGRYYARESMLVWDAQNRATTPMPPPKPEPKPCSPFTTLWRRAR